MFEISNVDYLGTVVMPVNNRKLVIRIAFSG